MPHTQELHRLINAFYQIISGHAGQPRDWDRFQSLFSPGAQLMPYPGHGGAQGVHPPYTVEAYIARLQPFLQQQDFFEQGLDYKVHLSGHIAQISSRYEARTTPTSKTLLKKGTNYIQAVHHGGQWKLLSMLWEDQ